MDEDQKNIIIYRTADGNASVALLAKDGKIWLNQQQMAELFTTSKQTISYHIINILKENELTESSVVKEYLTTAADGTLKTDGSSLRGGFSASCLNSLNVIIMIVARAIVHYLVGIMDRNGAPNEFIISILQQR